MTKDSGLNCTVFHPSLYKGKGSSLIYELYKNQQATEVNNIVTPQTFQYPRLFFKKFLGIQTVHAETLVAAPANTSTENTSTAVQADVSPLLRVFAQAYIDKETGKDRFRLILKRDHQNRMSQELVCLGQVMYLTYFISFVTKFVPSWHEAKDQFIREHRGTVFKTRQQAVRLLQDTALVKSLLPAAKFAVKITTFSTSIMIISQGISAYRNKTTPMEYIGAAAITGGIFRLHMGIRGMIAGSVLAGLLGTVVAIPIAGLMKSMGATQEERHLDVIMDRLETERSLVGEEEFKKKMTLLMETPNQVELLANSIQDD